MRQPNADDDAPPSSSSAARDLLSVVRAMQLRQSAWSAELQRLFASESAQRAESDSLSERVRESTAATASDSAFAEWLSRHAPVSVGEDALRAWFHTDALVAHAPFAALAPCPRCLSSSGRAELAHTVDALRLPRFFVQTVPLSLPLSRVAPAFVPGALHVPLDARRSKSALGALSYVGVPCVRGSDAVGLLEKHEILAEALARTPCLLLNDYVPRAPLCMHVVTVSGVCVAAEVACDARLATKFGLDTLREASGRDTHRCRSAPDDRGHSNESVEALAGALQRFTEEKMCDALERRSFRALLLCEAAAGREDAVHREDCPLRQDDIRFSLLNVDTIDGCEFECFEVREILAIAQHMAQRRADGVNLPPVLRFLGEERSNETTGRKNSE